MHLGGYFVIPQNEIRRFGIRRNGTEPDLVLITVLFVIFIAIVHRVPKKHVTTFSTITLTVSVRFQ